jgi:ribose-phosphate pyrophosphokinase
VKKIIIGLPESLLGREIATRCNGIFVPVRLSRFADSEVVSTLDNPEKISGSDVAVVFQFFHGSAAMWAGVYGNINDQLMGLFAILDLLNTLKAKTLTVILPYFAYARQDESSCKKYPGAVFMIGRCLRALGVKQVIVCDVHAPDIAKTFPLPLTNITMEPFWATVIKEKFMRGVGANQFCIASPDEGGRLRAELVAAQLGISSVFVKKERVAPDNAVGYELVGAVQGKNVIIVDDIIDTAHTALSACALLLQHGAVAVYGCFAHAVLSVGALERLQQSRLQKVFVVDTIVGVELGPQMNVVSINDYFSRAVADLLAQQNIF